MYESVQLAEVNVVRETEGEETLHAYTSPSRPVCLESAQLKATLVNTMRNSI